jgi:transcriptional regulator with XRE-family HTH domain
MGEQKTLAPQNAPCEQGGMEQLKSYLDKTGATLREFGRDARISASFLSEITSGLKNPSLPVALRIQAATNGAVPLSAWPNLKAVADAVNGVSQ